MRTPSGSVKPIRDGKTVVGYRARITWTDLQTGKRREREQRVASQNAGWDLVRRWVEEWRETRTITAKPVIPEIVQPVRRATFGELADFYEERYAKPAEYRDGKKLSGLRSYRTVRGHVRHLRQLIGDATHLDTITFGTFEDAREQLLAGETWQGKKRSIAYTNRVMSTARRMFRIARQRKLMTGDPWHDGEEKRLVNMRLEDPRTRVMSLAEEKALLSACTRSKNRAHLRPMIIMAVETGMREGEIVAAQRWEIKDSDGNPLPWVDWKEHVIYVTARYAKNGKDRIVPITPRLMKELKAWCKYRAPHEPSLFGLKVGGNVDTAWNGAKRQAKVKNLRFHDLKGTAVTRMLSAGIPGDIVSKIVGHESLEIVQPRAPRAAAITRKHYIRIDLSGAQDVGAKLNRSQRKPTSKRP